MRSTLCAASRTLTGILFVLICSNLAWADASSWLTAVSGNWSDATKWDNGLPNNGTTLYDAIIAATGANPYTVMMDVPIPTVNSFTLNSPQATLDIQSNRILKLASPTSRCDILAGTLRLDGGMIRGGQLDMHGNSITGNTTTDGWLDSVTVLSDLSLTNARLKIINTSFQGSTLTLASSRLTFQQDTVLDGKTVLMQGSASAALPCLATGSIQTLTLGVSTTVNSSWYAGFYGTVVNRGQISAPAACLETFINSGPIQIGLAYLGGTGLTWKNEAAGVISCDAALASTALTNQLWWPDSFGLYGTWQNDGTMTFANGTATIYGTGTNTGTMSFSGGSLTFPDAVATTPTVRNTGTMTFTNCNVTGMPTMEGNFSMTGGSWKFNSGERIDNTGHVLNIGGGANVRASGYDHTYGAGIKGGTIKAVGGVQLSGSLDGVTVEGDVTIPDKGCLTFDESGTLTPSVIHGNVNMSRGKLGSDLVAWGGSVTFANTNTSPQSPSSYLTPEWSLAVIGGGVPAGVTLTGSGSACIRAYTAVNKGTITLNQPKTTLWLWNESDPLGGVSSTTNDGVISVNNGAILHGTAQITNTGTVDVQGRNSTLSCTKYVQTGGVTHVGAEAYFDRTVYSCDFQGGRLEGSGLIMTRKDPLTCSIVVGNADVCPGDGIGSMLWGTDNAILGPASRLDVDLGAPSSSDLLDVEATLTTLQGSVNVTAWPGFGAGRYVIIKGTGTITDDGMRVGTMPDGFSATLDFSVPGEVGLMVVPEPATALLLVAGVLLGRVRRARVAR